MLERQQADKMPAVCNPAPQSKSAGISSGDRASSRPTLSLLADDAPGTGGPGSSSGSSTGQDHRTFFLLLCCPEILHPESREPTPPGAAPAPRAAGTGSPQTAEGARIGLGPAFLPCPHPGASAVAPSTILQRSNGDPGAPPQPCLKLSSLLDFFKLLNQNDKRLRMILPFKMQN